VWKKLDYWITYSPSMPNFCSIIFEEDKYWTPICVQAQGFNTLEEAQDACQKYHETYLKQFIEE
jgi:hypothetical protein